VEFLNNKNLTLPFLQSKNLDMLQKSWFTFILMVLVFSSNVYAQSGNTQVFSFLLLPSNSRIAALGDGLVSVNDKDIDLQYELPSLINDESANKLSFSYIGYLADLKYTGLNYGFNLKRLGVFVATFQYMSYGKFMETDVFGNEYGEFNASDYALSLGWSKKLFDNFTVGINFKNIFSHYYIANSYAIALDLSGTYNHPEGLFSTSMLLKNIGHQITSYNGEFESMPFRIQWGLSKKFEHAPIRLLFSLNDLQKWDLRENIVEVETSEIDGSTQEKSAFYTIGDNALRHIALGLELAPGKENFMIRVGYNYRRQQEMKLSGKTGMAGFSFGVGLRTKYMNIAYTRAAYHFAGGTNTFTIGTDINRFLDK
jgi:hypothetical protein